LDSNKREYLPVSLVVPFFNEKHKILELLESIIKLIEIPNEIIFVDAGSSDGGDALLIESIRGYINMGITMRILSPGGRLYPGAGRNIGIKSATNNLVAFLDVGIKPNVEWLKILYRYHQKLNSPGVYGVCKFESFSIFSKALCEISFGGGEYMRVLPCSIFNKSVFKEIGYFRDDLRAAEDLEWAGRYLNKFGRFEVCKEAKVSYVELPETYAEVFNKWFYSAHNNIIAKQKTQMSYAYTGITFLIISFIGSKFYFGLALLSVTYIILRILLKILSARHKDFFGIKFVFHMALIMLVIDFAKVMGFLFGFCKQIMSYRV